MLTPSEGEPPELSASPSRTEQRNTEGQNLRVNNTISSTGQFGHTQSMTSPEKSLTCDNILGGLIEESRSAAKIEEHNTSIVISHRMDLAFEPSNKGT